MFGLYHAATDFQSAPEFAKLTNQDHDFFFITPTGINKKISFPPKKAGLTIWLSGNVPQIGV